MSKTGKPKICPQCGVRERQKWRMYCVDCEAVNRQKELDRRAQYDITLTDAKKILRGIRSVRYEGVPKDSDEYIEKADSLSRIAYRRASHQNLDEKARIFWERLDKSLK